MVRGLLYTGIRAYVQSIGKYSMANGPVPEAGTAAVAVDDEWVPRTVAGKLHEQIETIFPKPDVAVVVEACDGGAARRHAPSPVGEGSIR